MDLLSYKTLREKATADFYLERAPERVLQFGEGNFLRAFVDYFTDISNERIGWNGKVVAVQPISNRAVKEKFDAQDGLFTLYLRGLENGGRVEKRRLISCISRIISAEDEFDAVLECAQNPDLRYIISNTTEAGIVFRSDDKIDSPGVAAFPGKLTLFLYERYRALPGSGFVLLPCELIDENGKNLLSCVKKYIKLWSLPGEFERWVVERNVFCSTLVDRIVPGYPADAATLNEQNGYLDKLMVTAEPFGFWAVEGPGFLNDELPFAKAGMPVLVTGDCKPYKQRKVRILNGAHSSVACAGLLCGLETVGEIMDDRLLRNFLECELADEIISTLDFPEEELRGFATSVKERFCNPFIRHELLAITLNATSKWRARVLPSLVEYLKSRGELPKLLAFSFAAYAEYNRCGKFECKDDREVLDFFAAHHADSAADLMRALCTETLFWGQNLCELPGFLAAVTAALEDIQNKGARTAIEGLLR